MVFNTDFGFHVVKKFDLSVHKPNDKIIQRLRFGGDVQHFNITKKHLNSAFISVIHPYQPPRSPPKSGFWTPGFTVTMSLMLNMM
jgi:hypothetical protein